MADWSRGFRSQRSVSRMALLYPVQAMESNQEKVITDGKLELVSGHGWDESLLSTIMIVLISIKIEKVKIFKKIVEWSLCLGHTYKSN